VESGRQGVSEEGWECGKVTWSEMGGCTREMHCDGESTVEGRGEVESGDVGTLCPRVAGALELLPVFFGVV
jgi:hypothetical protein